jgi:hypothetical protein
VRRPPRLVADHAVPLDWNPLLTHRFTDPRSATNPPMLWAPPRAHLTFFFSRSLSFLLFLLCFINFSREVLLASSLKWKIVSWYLLPLILWEQILFWYYGWTWIMGSHGWWLWYLSWFFIRLFQFSISMLSWVCWCSWYIDYCML